MDPQILDPLVSPGFLSCFDPYTLLEMGCGFLIFRQWIRMMSLLLCKADPSPSLLILSLSCLTFCFISSLFIEKSPRFEVNLSPFFLPRSSGFLVLRSSFCLLNSGPPFPRCIVKNGNSPQTFQAQIVVGPHYQWRKVFVTNRLPARVLTLARTALWLFVTRSPPLFSFHAFNSLNSISSRQSSTFLVPSLFKTLELF